MPIRLDEERTAEGVPPEERGLSPALRDMLRQVRTKKTRKEYDAEGHRIRNALPKAKP